MKTRILGIIFILIAIVIVLVVVYVNNPNSQVPIVFSEKEFLANTWHAYVQEYIENSTGRTLDKQQENITTSEGQSYTMLRAVWMDDKETFDKSYTWTKNNLSRKNDHLFSWLFGKENNTYKVLIDRGGANTATDADSDIALALIFAYNRWGDDTYINNAKAIVNDIWENEVVTIQGKPYLVANNLEKDSPNKVIINPSYLSPYSYRIFATIDSTHPWEKVVDSSYEIIQRGIDSNLDKSSTVKLPPDWIVMNKRTGAIEPANIANLTTNFSFDALRLPWRLALDWQWYKDPRAEELLSQMNFFSAEWKQKGMIATAYGHDGAVVLSREAPAVYGGVIGYFLVADPTYAEEVYTSKLKVLYDPDKKSWKSILSYYDDNWAWFGIALYNRLLPNLANHQEASEASKNGTGTSTSN